MTLNPVLDDLYLVFAAILMVAFRRYLARPVRLESGGERTRGNDVRFRSPNLSPRRPKGSVCERA